MVSEFRARSPRTVAILGGASEFGLALAASLARSEFGVKVISDFSNVSKQLMRSVSPGSVLSAVVIDTPTPEISALTIELLLAVNISFRACVLLVNDEWIGETRYRKLKQLLALRGIAYLETPRRIEPSQLVHWIRAVPGEDGKASIMAGAVDDSSLPFSLLFPIFLKHPGPLLKIARKTLGVDEQMLLKEAWRLGLDTSVETYLSYESEKDPSVEISSTEWFTLCGILQLSADSLSYGYSQREHLSRVRGAIQAREYRLPVTKGLEARLAELELFEQNEERDINSAVSRSKKREN